MRPTGGWMVMLLLPMLAPHARAAHGPVDTVFVLNLPSFPALALDPVSGDRHLAYLSGGILQHSWETAGVWQTEAVVDSASLTSYTGFHLRLAPDGHPVVAYVRKGAFVCAVRGGGGWQRDTLDVLPGPTFYPIALDLDPTTGEPAVAWAKQAASPGMPSTVWYARHSGGVWVAQQVDTTSSAWLNVALGIDGVGRPHLAWTRPRGDALPSRYVLTCASGAGPDGPFAAATVDSLFATVVNMAVDRSNGEPRLAYMASVHNFTDRARYAYRAPGGAWQPVEVAPGTGFANQPAPALALDPAGNPFISFTEVVPIEPGLAGAAGPDEIQACGGSLDLDVRVFYRAGGAGPAPFSFEYVNMFPSNRSQSGLSAVASGAIGETVLAWRVGIGCPPYGLATTTVTGPSLVGVGRLDSREMALSPVWPNPARPGDDLRVELTLAHETVIGLELHDLAGRRVALRSRSTVPAGRHAMSWTVPDLTPGLYWLAVRSDAGRIGTRAVVIVR